MKEEKALIGEARCGGSLPSAMWLPRVPEPAEFYLVFRNQSRDMAGGIWGSGLPPSGMLVLGF